MNIKGLFQINKSRAILILFLLIAIAIFNTAGSYFFKPATDNLVKGNLNNTLFFFLLMITAGIIGIILDAISQTLFSKQTQDYLDILRQKMVKHFYSTDNQTVSEMQNELGNNLDMLTDNYINSIFQIIRNSFSLLLIIGVLFQLNWTLLVLTTVLAIINLVTPKIMEKATDKANKQVSIENNRLLKAISNWLSGMNELRRYSSFTTMFETINKADSDLENSNVTSVKNVSLSFFISDFANVISQIVISLWAGILFFQGRITVGAALVVGDFISQVFNILWTYEQAIIQFNSVKSINQQTQKFEQPVSESQHDLSDDLAELTINNLIIKYPHGEEITYPRIDIHKGEKVLLTGDSGTGKSTLFKAILGQIKPKSGQVVFKDSKNQIINPNLSKIGYIAQDSVLFPDTIQNNITMFDEKLNSKVSDIVNKVQLQKDLARFPNGLETEIDLDSDNLSGGQKQKVVLARSQIHHSRFILMDEATSAIDRPTTERILKELLKSDATLILIAHNFDESLHKLFDREIHLEKRQTNDN